jgi:hypothetical protein
MAKAIDVISGGTQGVSAESELFYKNIKALLFELVQGPGHRFISASSADSNLA